MADKKKLLYVQTSGVDTPRRLYSPVVLGMTAQAMDIDATIYFLGLGITVVKNGGGGEGQGRQLSDIEGDDGSGRCRRGQILGL